MSALTGDWRPRPPGQDPDMTRAGRPCEVAFLLGGEGILGAHEVGMLRALAESSIEPDIILGTP